jgi:hypothetical protein
VPAWNQFEIGNPAPGTPATLIMSLGVARRNLHIPFLDINGYYNFLGAMMIVLFVVGLVVVFVYEYEALRRSKT